MILDSNKMAELNMNESHKVLESNGLYVDDLSRVRVVDPEIADASGKRPQVILHPDISDWRAQPKLYTSSWSLHD